MGAEKGGDYSAPTGLFGWISITCVGTSTGCKARALFAPDCAKSRSYYNHQREEEPMKQLFAALVAAAFAAASFTAVAQDKMDKKDAKKTEAKKTADKKKPADKKPADKKPADKKATDKKAGDKK